MEAEHATESDSPMEDDEQDYTDPNDSACTNIYRLPLWLVSECPDQPSKLHTLNNYFMMRTANNGDCLFHSVHLCLMTVMGRKAYTTYELRLAVANTVMKEENRKITHILDSWRSLLAYANKENDSEIQRDYKHAEPLLRDEPPFSTSTRADLRDNMLDVGTYWGDEYAIQILERLMKIKFLILKRMKIGRRFVVRGQFGVNHQTSFEPLWYIILVLEGAHYMPIVQRIYRKNDTIVPPHPRQHSPADTNHYEEEYVAAFKKREIPDFVVRAYGSSGIP
jgi:hypothetical protein